LFNPIFKIFVRIIGIPFPFLSSIIYTPHLHQPLLQTYQSSNNYHQQPNKLLPLKPQIKQPPSPPPTPPLNSLLSPTAYTHDSNAFSLSNNDLIYTNNTYHLLRHLFPLMHLIHLK
jgi:hypothetical protein